MISLPSWRGPLLDGTSENSQIEVVLTRSTKAAIVVMLNKATRQGVVSFFNTFSYKGTNQQTAKNTNLNFIVGYFAFQSG